MEVPAEMMKRSEQIRELLYRMVPKDVMFMITLATGGKDGWVILKGNLSDEGLREAMKEIASRI